MCFAQVQEAAASIWPIASEGTATGVCDCQEAEYQLGDKVCVAGEATECLLRLHGYQTLLPIGPSLDAYDWDWLASESPTPFDSLLGEEVSEREASIEAFYDIVVDIVSKQMGLTRRQYYTAHKDATALVCVLHSKNTKALMAEFDCSYSGAYARLRQARERLCAFLEEKGEDAVVEMYKGPKMWCDARARRAFIAHYVAEQRAVYETKREKTAPDASRAVKRWRRKGRAVLHSVGGGGA